MKNNTSEPPGRAPRRPSVISLSQNSLPQVTPSIGERVSPRIYRSVDDMVHELRPELPVHCLRPATITATAKRFLKQFPGDVLYAVKTNPDPRVLAYISKAG